MKVCLLTLVMITTAGVSVLAQGLTLQQSAILIQGGDLNKVPVREEPGPNAVTITEQVHEKTVQVVSDSLKFKWTALGYGAMTHKVIVPDLVHHTVFNHRNDGEDGPCLKSDAFHMEDRSLALNPPTQQPENQVINIEVKILNEYTIDRPKNICKVKMVEDVRTTINGEEFYHRLTKDMGYRFIDDCPTQN